MGSPLAAAAQLHGFTYFIVQMLLMTMVMPWLLLLTVPVWLFDASLQFPVVRHIVQRVTHPIAATALYNLVTTVFLVPAVFNADLKYNWLHVFNQSIVMLLSVFLWWPLASQSTVVPQPRKGIQLFYILFSVNFMMPIVVLLLIAHVPWYPVFQHTSWPVSWSLLADQQAGAILMFVGMALAYGIRALAIYLQYDSSKWYE
jgi:cytochrome c oxidase assembly factor CtaG